MATPERPQRELSVASGSALLFGAQIVANTGFFVAVLILARGLSPAGRGVVAFVTVTAAVTAKLMALGAGQSATVLAARRPEQRGELLTGLMTFVFLAGATGGAIVSAGLALLPHVRPAGMGAAVLTMLAAATAVASVADSGYGFLLGSGRLAAQAAITAAAPWVYALLLGLVWALTGLTVERAVAVWLAWHGVWASSLLVASSRGIGFGRLRSEVVRDLVSLGTRLWVGTLSRFLNFRVDQILMGFLATEAALGIYAIAVNASEILLYLPGAVATAMLPVVARAAAAEQVERTLGTFRVLMLLTVPATLVAAALGPVLVPLVFGDAYDGSVGPYLWLLPGAVGFAASGVFSSALTATARPVLASLGPLVSLVSGFVLDLVLIPPFGATGAAAAATAAFLGGGAVAIAAYAAVTHFDARLLLPRADDVRAVRTLTAGLAARARGRAAPMDI